MDDIKVVDIGIKNEMKAASEELKRTLPEMLENLTLVAQLRRASYKAHLEEGFTESEALELCKSLLL